MIKNYLLFLLLFVCLFSNAQVGIGTTTPDNSAALEINSTTKGLLIPKMNESQKNGITSPATGLLIFQTDGTSGFYYYNGSSWVTFGADADWTINANDMYNVNSGNIGIGTTTPSTKLHIEDTSSGSTIAFNDGFEDATLTPFNSSDWSITNSAGEYNSGSNGVQAGAYNVDDGLSTMTLTVNIPAGGSNYSFYYRVSSESSFDYFKFEIDGSQQMQDSGNGSWSQYTGTLTAGTHTLSWIYEKDGSVNSNDDTVYIDDITIDAVKSGGSVLRIVDGNQTNGYVLTSDANGNASWSDPSSISATDNDWTISGTDIYSANTNNVGIGVANPNYKLHVEDNSAGKSVIYAENLDTTVAGSYGLHGITHSVDNLGSSGVFGESVTNGDHEIGVKGDYAFWGAAVAGFAWATDVSDMPTTGSASGETNDMGVFGSVNYDTGVGVYALNLDNVGYASYVDGNFAVVTGTKSGSVPTTQGNQLVYSMESPEIWFEDFGTGTLVNGQVHINLDEMFFETVKIDNQHPMHVFLQEQGDSNGLFVIPDNDGKGFTVKERANGNSSIQFSYRITAKRRFFEEQRFGVDQMQPLEDNLSKAKKRQKRTSNLSKMKLKLQQSAAKKRSAKK